MPKILFVCHGNICRSPMAEFVMKKMVAELQDGAGNDAAGLECAESRAAEKNCADFEIASAATSTEEIGNPVYPPARRMLERHGIDCRGKTARQMTLRDYEYYDYIVLMDRNNLRNLRWILPPAIYERECAGGGKVSLLMDWTGNSRDVADPWYTGDFEATWNDVNEGCRAMLTSLRNGQA
ncbi:low molecular weight protein-tyrosine-phosphatase [Fibrobacter sp.]|uniref:low molecular weight protein-tyrosine-phosphatase n=1 Tax=Fibrobacter sp. TaxID=35828 RepID=UPI0025BBAED2|nr:low molecular weight protein-tyrosine-phosphatase [Fibrobacter sp.]MBR4008589.1 low molecular weight phosphotyrosine protein phosphatase [Fibrobacter sp.]